MAGYCGLCNTYYDCHFTQHEEECTSGAWETEERTCRSCLVPLVNGEIGDECEQCFNFDR